MLKVEELLNSDSLVNLQGTHTENMSVQIDESLMDTPVMVKVHIDKEPPPRQSCKVTYRLRQVSSKGAFLVLFWVMLANAGTGSTTIALTQLVTVKENRLPSNLTVAFQYINSILPTASWLVTAAVFGWIADSKLGNYRAVKLGLSTLFVANVLDCIIVLIETGTVSGEPSSNWFILAQTIPKSIKFVGNAMVIVTSVQLALDQMPGASSESITSFIAWFVFIGIAGVWINLLGISIPQACLSVSTYNDMYKPVQYLLPVVWLSIALCIDFFFSRKWLIKLPKSSKSFSTIYRALKFAAKHKAPLNRSAFTYWEEDIPSRVDLGKSKYGGPFTTEQVENVKTALNMLKLSIPFTFVLISYTLYGHTLEYLQTVSSMPSNSDSITGCTRATLQLTVVGTPCWIMFLTLVYEYTIYPFITKWVPTSLKRIGIVSALTLIINSIHLLLGGVSYTHDNNIGVDLLWLQLLQAIINALIQVLLFTAILEFLCAQSPYNMRSFVIGYMWCTYFASSIAAAVIFSMMVKICQQTYCLVVYCAIMTIISFIGFLIICILSNRYKKRERGETQTPQVWAEAAYNRYLISVSQN